jgi:ATP-dependent DNA helicase RecQ
VWALDYLAEQGLLEVRAAGLRHPYRWLRPPEDLDALASSLHQRTFERETREIARLDQVLTLAAHDGCQTAFLAAHFGEQFSHPCGHCSWCENGGQPAKLLPPAPVHLDEERLRRAANLRREIPDLASPRALARFLTGLPSPRLTRGKLKSHPLFGAFAQVPSRRCCGGWRRGRVVGRGPPSLEADRSYVSGAQDQHVIKIYRLFNNCSISR